jgi:hypothetical protein
MFNRPIGTGAGHLLRRVNFADPDNFAAFYRRRPPIPPSSRAGQVAPTEASNLYSTPVNIGRTWIFALNKR